MKVAIVGTGGVGGYFGGKLAQAGHEVTFVARGDHLRAIQANGLQVRSIGGDFKVWPARATDNLDQVGSVDLVLLGVKAWQIQELAPRLKTMLHARTTVLPLQNGVLAAVELVEALGEGPVVGGLCRIISRIAAPGFIEHSGIKPLVTIGELDNQKTERVFLIQEQLKGAGIACKVAPDIQVELWTKFMAICVSGLLAVARCTYGAARERPETRRLMAELLAEIHALAGRLGVALDPQAVEKTMAFIDSYPYDSTSSLTRDVLAGRPSEIEYQNGTVVRLAAQVLLDAPVNRFVYSCILPMEASARSAKPGLT